VSRRRTKTLATAALCRNSIGRGRSEPGDQAQAPTALENLKVLQISPYEPPASGWTNRIKLVRRVIEERGGVCEILDIGPSRRIRRADCIGAQDGPDFLAKVWAFARRGYTVHCHINADYFRGLLLAVAALTIARTGGNRCLVTFHGGPQQRYLTGPKRHLVIPFVRAVLALAHAVICNSGEEKFVLSRYCSPNRIFPIAAFSRQYLEYRQVELNASVESFLQRRPLAVSTYVCFRDGFFTEVLVGAIAMLTREWPQLGMVVVGTGDGAPEFEALLISAGVRDDVYLAGDLTHDAFMTLLARSVVHVRTPTTDGVSATVLEALSLGIPVVASENGTRPPSVVTYRGDDPADLLRALRMVLSNLEQVVASVRRPEIADTAATEVALIADRCPLPG
jgi:glycosyltransferase involved in cell wall biosynthesis